MNKALRILMMGLASLSLASCSGGESQPFEVSYSITKEPTCTEKGREEGYDENGILIGRDIPVLGHSYDSGTLVKEATCEEAGERRYACSRCQQTKSEEIPALGHSVSADYSHDENSHYKTCSRCNKHLEEGKHNFQFKSSTNLEPKYYFPENYYYVSSELKPSFGFDENGKEIMGAINEYSCPTCGESFFKAEFITAYSKDYSTNASYYDTGYRNEWVYEYDDYKIKSVSKKVIDNDNNANATGIYYEYLYADDGLTITRYSVSSDGNTKTPYLKCIMTLDGNKATKIEHYYYQNSNSTWSERTLWFEFTYDEKGNVAKCKQSYLSSMYIETTFLVHDAYSETFKALKEVYYDEDGTALSTYDYSYDESGKILSRTFTNHELGQVSTKNYTYDSEGRLLSNGSYHYEYYDGDSYRYYLGDALQKDVQINSEGITVKQTDYYSTLTKVYELLSQSFTENESILSSKTAWDYDEDDRDYVQEDYLKSTFSNGLLTKTYEKKELEYSVQTYLNSNGTIETNTDYEYTSRKFRSKISSTANSKWVNEDRNETQTSSLETYSFQEFSISKSILPAVK